MTEGFAGATQTYARWTVMCPLKGCRHKDPTKPPCQKRRNTGSAQTANYGIAEVYGYLGVRLKEAHNKANRKEHVDFKPTRAQIKRYCEENGRL